MTHDEALTWYAEIISGSGVDRYSNLDVLDRGAFAVKYWDNTIFVLGIEYGVLIALIRAFDLTDEEIAVAERNTKAEIGT